MTGSKVQVDRETLKSLIVECLKVDHVLGRIAGGGTELGDELVTRALGVAPSCGIGAVFFSDSEDVDPEWEEIEAEARVAAHQFLVDYHPHAHA